MFTVRYGLLTFFSSLKCRVLLKFEVFREFIVSDSGSLSVCKE